MILITYLQRTKTFCWPQFDSCSTLFFLQDSFQPRAIATVWGLPFAFQPNQPHHAATVAAAAEQYVVQSVLVSGAHLQLVWTRASGARAYRAARVSAPDAWIHRAMGPARVALSCAAVRTRSRCFVAAESSSHESQSPVS